MVWAVTERSQDRTLSKNHPFFENRPSYASRVLRQVNRPVSVGHCLFGPSIFPFETVHIMWNFPDSVHWYRTIPSLIFDELDIVMSKTTTGDSQNIQTSPNEAVQDYITGSWLVWMVRASPMTIISIGFVILTGWSNLNWMNWVFLLVKTVFVSKYFFYWSIDHHFWIIKMQQLNFRKMKFVWDRKILVHLACDVSYSHWVGVLYGSIDAELNS